MASTFGAMYVTVRDIADPSYVRKVHINSWKGWPKSKTQEGAKMAGHRTMVEVTEEQAKAPKPTSVRMPPVPPVVERVTGKPAAGELIAKINAATTAEEVDEILGDDTRPTVKAAAAERKEALQ